MLAAIGMNSIEDLFRDVPVEVRLGRPLDIPPPHSEFEVTTRLEALAARNGDASAYTCFLGGGTSIRYIPAIVKHLIGRSEFYTSYTPYQP
ncbi:MAG: glycine dehydrogenase, partial [Euryarchaeota archaeon]|nr:glycine dehydrogenase [Euryarchaeota archaeon]